MTGCVKGHVSLWHPCPASFSNKDGARGSEQAKPQLTALTRQLLLMLGASVLNGHSARSQGKVIKQDAIYEVISIVLKYSAQC